MGLVRSLKATLRAIYTLNPHGDEAGWKTRDRQTAPADGTSSQVSKGVRNLMKL
jgi:hypothetical protein